MVDLALQNLLWCPLALSAEALQFRQILQDHTHIQLVYAVCYLALHHWHDTVSRRKLVEHIVIRCCSGDLLYLRRDPHAVHRQYTLRQKRPCQGPPTAAALQTQTYVITKSYLG